MILPLAGCLCSFGMFAVIGYVVLRLTGVRPIRPLVLITFVLAAQVGAIAFGACYGALLSDTNNKLQSTAAVVCFLAGMPIFGGLVGWIAARAVTWLFSRRAPPS